MDKWSFRQYKDSTVNEWIVDGHMDTCQTRMEYKMDNSFNGYIFLTS